MYGILCTILVSSLFIVGAANGYCPSACDCKWKSGKQTVECRHRGLMTVPGNIDSETQVLDLSGNNLNVLPREVFSKNGLLNLQKIFLQNCKIGAVEPTAFRGLTNLVELDLSDNLLTSVPSLAFRDAPSLRELRLNANPLQRVEDQAFEFLAGLVKLDLSDCQLQTIEARAFEGLDQLSHLRLSGNALTELNKKLVSTLTRLHALDLHRNPWICDCRSRPLREWLQEQNIPMPIPPVCSTPTRLRDRPLLELQLDEFACPPQVLPTPGLSKHVEVPAGENATFVCRIKAEPTPEITWLWHGRPLANTTEYPSTTGALSGSGYTSGGRASTAGYHTTLRTVMVLEHGEVEKVSTLILYPVRESDSGELTCVAANRAGLVQTNFTLRVEARGPIAGGLGSAQMAGLGAGIFFLLAVTLLIFGLFMWRCRKRRSEATGAQQKYPPSTDTSSDSSSRTTGPRGGNYADPLQKPSSSPAKENFGFGYPDQHATSPSRGGINGTLSNPDLINEAEKASKYWQGAITPSPRLNAGNNVFRTMERANIRSNPTAEYYERDSIDSNGIVPHGDSYLRPQTDPQYTTSRMWSPNSADYVTSIHPTDTYASVPAYAIGNGTLRQNPRMNDTSSELSLDHYAAIVRSTAQDDDDWSPNAPYTTQQSYVTYPADFGLPRIGKEVLPESPLANNKYMTMGRSPVSTSTLATRVLPNGSTSTPLGGQLEPNFSSSSNSPRLWHRPQHSVGQATLPNSQTNSPASAGTSSGDTLATKVAANGSPSGTKRSAARDSPDEGYQEECATDV